MEDQDSKVAKIIFHLFMFPIYLGLGGLLIVILILLLMLFIYFLVTYL